MLQKEILGKRLLSLRKDKDISQQALAEHINVSFYQISKMETGQRGASMEVISALADFFDVPADFLLARPPFDNWESYAHRLDTVLDALISLELVPTVPRSLLTLSNIIRLIAATVARIDVQPDDTINISPLLPSLFPDLHDH